MRAATNGSGVQTRWPGDPVVWESTSYVSPGQRPQLRHPPGDRRRGPGQLSGLRQGRPDRLSPGCGEPALAAGAAPGRPRRRGVRPALRSAAPATGLCHDPPQRPVAQQPTAARPGRRPTPACRAAPSCAGWPSARRRRAACTSGRPARRAGFTPAPTAATVGRRSTTTLTFTTIHAFAADPTDPEVAYAGAWGGGTWKTVDGGANWTLLPEAPVSAAALAVDPRDPQIVYATDRTEPTLWQSADGGQHWWRRFRAGDDVQPAASAGRGPAPGRHRVRLGL